MPTSNLLCSASSRRCASSRDACAACTRFGVVPDADGRVGDLGRDLQLDLLELRLDLAQLHARAGHGRVLAAQADRVGDVQLRRSTADSCRPKSEPSASLMPPGIDRRRRWLPSMPDVQRCRYGPPTPWHAVVDLQVHVGQRLVAQVLQRRRVVLDVLPGNLEVGALLERPLDGRLDVDRLGRERRADRSRRASPVQFGSSVPATMRRLSVSSAVRLADSALTSVCRRIGGLGLRLDDVDRRHRADLDARPGCPARAWSASSSDWRATSTACVAKT